MIKCSTTLFEVFLLRLISCKYYVLFNQWVASDVENSDLCICRWIGWGVQSSLASTGSSSSSTSTTAAFQYQVCPVLVQMRLGLLVLRVSFWTRSSYGPNQRVLNLFLKCVVNRKPAEDLDTLEISVALGLASMARSKRQKGNTGCTAASGERAWNLSAAGIASSHELFITTSRVCAIGTTMTPSVHDC